MASVSRANIRSFVHATAIHRSSRVRKWLCGAALSAREPMRSRTCPSKPKTGMASSSTRTIGS